MTATPITGPRFTDAQMRTARIAAVRRAAELQAEQAITEDEAAARIGRLTAHNHHLTPEQRGELHERLVEAIQRIAYYRGDDFDPAAFTIDRESLELAADYDAEGAVRELIGGLA